MARQIHRANLGSIPASARVASEPCRSCGEETAAGSVFFSDRRTIAATDGQPDYLCALCEARIRASRRGVHLTDDEVRQFVENGSAIATGWRP